MLLVHNTNAKRKCDDGTSASTFFFFTNNNRHHRSASESIEPFPAIEKSPFEMTETLNALMQTSRKRSRKMPRDGKCPVSSIVESPRTRKRRMVRSMAMPSLHIPSMPVDPAEADVSFESLLTKAVRMSTDCEMKEDVTENGDSTSIGLSMDVPEQLLTPSSSYFPTQNSIG